MGLFKKSIKTFSWTFLGSIIGFIFQLFIARILGAEEFGKANLILGFVGSYYTILNFGFKTLLIRESGKFPSKANYLLSEIFIAYILIDSLTLPFIFISLKNGLLKVGFYNIFNLSIIILLLFLTQTSKLLYAYFVGIKRQNYTSFLRDIISRFIKIASFFLLYIFLSNYISYILSIVISLFIIFFITLSKLIKIKKIRIKWLFYNSWQFYLISITYSLYNNLSKILQKAYATSETVGYLSIGIALGNIGTMLGSALASVIMPEFASAWKEKKITKIDNLFKEVSRWNAFIILPIVLFLIINIAKILSFLGKDYSNGSTIVIVILISQFVNSFLGPNGTLLNMSGYQRFEIFNGIAMIITGITSGYIFGPKINWGIALSLSLATIIGNVLKFIEVSIIYKIYPYKLKTLFYIIIIGGLTSIALIIVKNLFDNIFLWATVNLTVIIIIIGLTFKFSPIRNDREIVDKIINRIKTFRKK